MGRVHLVRDLDYEVARSTVVVGVPTVGLAAVQVDAVVCIGAAFFPAHVLSSGGAVAAFTPSVATGVGLGADSNTVADFDMFDLGSYPDGDADDLVADHAGVHGWALATVC